jgi:hypothetical protein
MNNEIFNSEELKNAVSVPSSITYYELPKIDTQHLKDEIKKFLILKDPKLLQIYDNASMGRISKSSGNENLKNLLHLIRDLFVLKFKEDNIKNLTVRKNIDIMLIALESMMVNNIDCSAEEINALILGYVTKNL